MASAMALSTTTKDEEKRLKMLKFSRRWKKSSITRRVDELERLVAEKGSRRRITFLMEALLNVFKEVTEVCVKIAVLSDEIDSKNDLELYKAKIDSCIALVTEYLDSRREDPPSSESMCSTWVAQHAVGMLEEISRDGSSSAEAVSTVPEETVATSTIAEELVFLADSDIVEGTTLTQDLNGKMSVGEGGNNVMLDFLGTQVEKQCSYWIVLGLRV